MTPTEKIVDGPDCYPWRPVFAWWPVRTISGRLIWGRQVYKQKYWTVMGFHFEPQVEYAELFDILSQ